MQLNLFEWDLIAVGSGYAGLARLDFEEARCCFTRVLQTIPEHPRASQGLRDLRFWQDALEGMGRLAAEPALRLGWHSLTSFSFDRSDAHQLLRRNILRHLLDLMADLHDFYDPPHLCSGYLYLQTGDCVAAERELLRLLKAQPHTGLIHLFLAEALRRQEREEQAAPSYARALLLDPVESFQQHISNAALMHLCEEQGPALAPIYGYIGGLLPLVEIEGMPESPEIRIYAALRRAELSRRKGDHDDMIAARCELKGFAPEIFKDYLEGVKKNVSP